MRVFLSWSGDISKNLARALRDWLPVVMPNLEPFVSTEDIDRGAYWPDELKKQLNGSQFGILCLTRESVNAPWLNFEAGVLSKVPTTPLLFDVTLPEITNSPLALRQCTFFTKEDLLKLVQSISKAGSAKLLISPAHLDRNFAICWSGLNEQLNQRLCPHPIDGAIPFEGFLRDIPLATLDSFYKRAHSKLDIIGHSLSGLWEGNGREAILTALINGATVRIIFLDPTQIHSDQITQIGRRVNHDLKEKIEQSLNQAHSFINNLREDLTTMCPDIDSEKIVSARERLQIAVSRLISYTHIQKVDDVMLVSQYSQSLEPGRDAPTIAIVKGNMPRLFEFYEQEFGRIWEESLPIEEVLSPNGIYVDRSRILAHLPTIQAVYRSVKSNDDNRKRLPFPRMLVVLPNMSCKLRCPNCFTWNSGVMPSDQRMELSLIESIVRQAAEMEVSCVELSGGGEPLEHPEAEKMLQVLVEGRNKHKTFRAGLITNGLEITRMLNLGDWIVQLDYVRLGYTEYFDRPGHDSAKSLFWEALEILGQKKMQDERAKVRIGVKLLLTRDNATSLEERLEGILRLKARRTQRYVVDHVKIKSIRGDNEPTPDLIRAMEHKLTLLKSKLGERANDLQIDIKSAKVPSTYSCWINPIMSVIGVSGDVYLCCNFYECPDDLKIGSLGIKGEDHFREFWGKARHRDVMDRVAPASVCNSRWGCHCRLVHYQELVEPFVPYSDRDTPVIGTFFVGHEKML